MSWCSLHGYYSTTSGVCPQCTSYFYPTQPVQMRVTLQGWECPRCGAVNAPHIAQCTCHHVTTSYGHIPVALAAVSPVPSAPREPAGEPTDDAYRAIDDALSAMREPLTLSDARYGRNILTSFYNRWQLSQASAPRPDARERQQATNAGDSKLFTELHLICAMREAFAEALCMASNHDKGAAVAVSCLPCWKFAERRFPISARPDVREEER